MGEQTDSSNITQTDNEKTADSENQSNASNAAVNPIDAIVSEHTASIGTFDPDKHAVDADGNPKIKSNGEFAAKRGRKAGTVLNGGKAIAPDSGLKTTVKKSPLPPKDSKAKVSDDVLIDNAAAQVTNLFIGVGVAIFGEDFAPESKDEAVGVKFAFKNYFEESGVIDVPPSIGLIFALAAYSLPKLQKEKPMKKLDNLLIWIKAKLF